MNNRVQCDRDYERRNRGGGVGAYRKVPIPLFQLVCMWGWGGGVVRVSVPEEMTCKPRSESLGPLMGSSGVGTHGDG